MSEPPVGWRLTALGDVCATVLKQDPAAQPRENIRYVDIGSVDGEEHRVKDVAEIPAASAPARARQVLATGDTVFSTVRPYLEKIAFIDDALDGAFASTGFCVLRPTTAVLPRWLFHFATSSTLLDQVLPLQRGVSYPAVRDKDVLSSQIPLPPIEDQQRIVDVLEEHLSRLDAAELSLATNLDRISRLREGLLERRFVAQPPAGSQRRALVDLIEPGRAMAYGVLVPGPDTAGGIRLVRVGDIRGGEVHTAAMKRISPAVSAKFPRTLLRGGELLLSLVGTIGRVGVAPSSLAGANVARAVGVLPLSDEVDARYVAYALQAPSAQRDLEGRAHEVARKTLNLEDLRRVEVPVPAVDVQNAIVAELGEQLAGLALMENALHNAQARSRGLRRSLLAAAFAGRLVRDHPIALEM